MCKKPLMRCAFNAVQRRTTQWDLNDDDISKLVKQSIISKFHNINASCHLVLIATFTFYVECVRRIFQSFRYRNKDRNSMKYTLVESGLNGRLAKEKFRFPVQQPNRDPAGYAPCCISVFLYVVYRSD